MGHLDKKGEWRSFVMSVWDPSKGDTMNMREQVWGNHLMEAGNTLVVGELQRRCFSGNC